VNYITPEEAAAITKALEYYEAYLKSQRREQAIYARLVEKYRKMAGE